MRTSCVLVNAMVCVLWIWYSPGATAERQVKGGGTMEAGIQKIDFGKTADEAAYVVDRLNRFPERKLAVWPCEITARWIRIGLVHQGRNDQPSRRNSWFQPLKAQVVSVAREPARA